ncbi:hypothetical protein D3C77_678280 [compost metagenome]
MMSTGITSSQLRSFGSSGASPWAGRSSPLATLALFSFSRRNNHQAPAAATAPRLRKARWGIPGTLPIISRMPAEITSALGFSNSWPSTAVPMS